MVFASSRPSSWKPNSSLLKGTLSSTSQHPLHSHGQCYHLSRSSESQSCLLGFEGDPVKKHPFYFCLELEASWEIRYKNRIHGVKCQFYHWQKWIGECWFHSVITPDNIPSLWNWTYPPNCRLSLEIQGQTLPGTCSPGQAEDTYVLRAIHAARRKIHRSNWDLCTRAFS